MGEINFVFCTDEELLDINVEFLQHDAFTDIITFDYSTEGHISGEIFISHDRVVANATRMQIPVVEEFHRIIIHGVLHLLGYNDKSTIEKSIMTSKEDYYLSLQTKF
ncbi:MAG TPA: rRNA maturation RNase YbeY [Bacteroidales bacterium]|nr:rRNA maturation RNase YbeY [Bacteroidales bacterium]